MRRLPIFPLAAAVAFSVTASAAAETPADFQRSFETAARQEAAGFAGFSAQRGAAFFKTTHGREWSCASCHTQNPTATGRHAKTDKPITPLAPAANAERFTRPDKVEKWFRRNCNDVLGRACTASEKGDVLAYLMSLGK
jgi:mono/diheme cytochrome c family protein